MRQLYLYIHKYIHTQEETQEEILRGVVGPGRIYEVEVNSVKINKKVYLISFDTAVFRVFSYLPVITVFTETSCLGVNRR